MLHLHLIMARCHVKWGEATSWLIIRDGRIGSQFVSNNFVRELEKWLFKLKCHHHKTACWGLLGWGSMSIGDPNWGQNEKFCIMTLDKKVLLFLGSCCGSAGRAVTSDTTGPWFFKNKFLLFSILCFIITWLIWWQYNWPNGALTERKMMIDQKNF